MRIGDRVIGPDAPPYVIAELGVNHDGRPDRALALTDAAAAAGADAVKLQYFRAERLLSRRAGLARYQADGGAADVATMLRGLELDLDAMIAVADRAHARGLHAVVTPFSVETVDALAGQPWDAIKIASPDVVNRPLIERAMALGRPLLVSTGAATPEEVERAAAWLAGHPHVLLQCVSAYPAADENDDLPLPRDHVDTFLYLMSVESSENGEIFTP